MINAKKLKQRMRERSVTQIELAKKIGLSKTALCQKINNIRPMMLTEAEEIATTLDISNCQFSGYFFWQ